MDLVGVSALTLVYLKVSRMTEGPEETLSNAQKEYAVLCSDLQWLVN